MGPAGIVTTQSPTDRNKEIVLLVALFLFSFFARLIYLEQIKNNPFFTAPFVDSYSYDRDANTISYTNDWFCGRHVFYQAPFYPYFLAIIYKIFGHNYYLARLLQIIIGSLSCLLLYLIAKKLFNQKIAIAAALIAAVYGPFIFFDAELLRPCLIIFLNLLLMLMLLGISEGPTYRRLFLAGVIMGLSILTKENIALFIPFVWLWLYLVFRKLKPNKEILFYCTAFSLAIFMVILPCTLRNYMVEKDFVPISSEGGINFYIGNTGDVDKLVALQPGTQWNKLLILPNEKSGKELKPSQWSDWYFREAFKFIAQHPFEWLRIISKKFLLFWNSFEFTPNNDIEFYRSHSSILHVLTGKFLGIWYPFGIVVPLALCGLIISLARWRTFMLLYFYVFSYMVSVILFHVRARYRLPVIPVLIIFAAYALWWFFQQYRDKKYHSVIKAVIVLVGLVFLINCDFYQVHRIKLFPLHFHLGNAYRKTAQYDKAIEEYQKAIDTDSKTLDLNSNYAEAHNNLGVLLEGMGRTDEALAHYLKALEIDPNDNEAHNNLGILLSNMGRTDEAMTHYLKALEINPNYAEAHNNLGLLLDGIGRTDEAMANYQKALELNPYYAEAHNNLGILLAKMGQTNEAIIHFQKALKLNPYFGNVHYNLSILLAKMGRTDEAMAHYRKAVELNPSHARSP
jgi:tetratricopeptide (TPR) repeat protein